MKTSAVSVDTVESNTLLNKELLNIIYYKKIGVLCLYEDTG